MATFASFSVATLVSAQAFALDLGVGVFVGGGATALPPPEQGTVSKGTTTLDVNSFSGPIAGGGLFVDARLLDFLGVEVDVFRSSDRGTSDITFKGVTGESLKIGQSATHIPVLAKLVLPLPLLRPYLMAGPEFVLPGTSEATSEKATMTASAYAESYTLITGGLGLEIKLPLPVIDLRIPLSVRGSLNPSTSREVADRVSIDINDKVSYRSEWKYQLLATAGVGLYF